MNRDLQRIRERAYEIWEQEGRPEGREQEHWREAERQLEVEFRVGFPDSSAETLPAEDVGGADEDLVRATARATVKRAVQ